MTTLDTLYERLYHRLEAICKECNDIAQEMSSLKGKWEDRVEYNQEELVEQKKIIQKQETTLLAYINIAKAHTNDLRDPGTMEAYDNEMLSRLAVQISRKDDPYAVKLYTHAICQLRYIQGQTASAGNMMTQKNSEAAMDLQQGIRDCEARLQEAYDRVQAVLCSEDFSSLVEACTTDRYFYEDDEQRTGLPANTDSISIGVKRVPFPLPEAMEDKACELSKGTYDKSTHTISIPVTYSIVQGEGLLVEYEGEDEGTVLKGIQNLVMNVLKYCGDSYDQILYVDPVRYNSSSLGILQPLSAGAGSVIDDVPLSPEEVKKVLSALIEQIQSDEHKIMYFEEVSMPKRLLIFHDFPRGYDAAAISQIQQLFVNASHYNLSVIATQNVTMRNSSKDVLELIQLVAKRIACDDLGFWYTDTISRALFQWYQAPDKLPEQLSQRIAAEKAEVDRCNDYEIRVGISKQPKYEKGVRYFDKIPYGVDENGKVLSLDFENTNFATFICGASRSGKSTLLHTLITGMIQQNHPDDVEIWLIDFKMTEFSRYIEHCPLHVRYIILDESPELVYDIIDRLTEIMIKRQNVFKGKWQKLKEVPKEKYMPAIMVIIDEFSVMSEIIANSVMNGKDNYSIKLQSLLAKGAALGLHFIFASQGFTTGTRGLNDFSKKQIQQRIAMKTDFNEIRETLDIKSAGDGDKAIMEQLPVYHALVRIPVDKWGNHVRKTQVLFISDYAKQEELIERIRETCRPAPKYDVTDVSKYIDKKTLVIDGNCYTSFRSRQEEIRTLLADRSAADEDEVSLFLGEPRRMLPFAPISIYNGFCENMLVLTSMREKTAASSLILSVAESLQEAGKTAEIWTHTKNGIYRQLMNVAREKFAGVSDKLGDVCIQMKELRKAIENRIQGDRFIVFLGAETLFQEMGYLIPGSVVPKGSDDKRSRLANMTIEKREPGQEDLITRLKRMKEAGVSVKATEKTQEEPVETVASIEPNSAYDAREDFKFILTQGPRLGYHFILVYQSVGEWNQNKLDGNLFKHKILFRMPKADAVSINGSAGANDIAELPDHVFRYSNGINAVSFRPYLHPGLSWDGWMTDENGCVYLKEEDEYLM